MYIQKWVGLVSAPLLIGSLKAQTVNMGLFWLVTAMCIAIIALLMALVIYFKRRSERDGMTGLYSKEMTERRIISALRRYHSGTAFLMLVDVDDLKGINDRLGHSEGDRAILACAQALREQFDKTDIVGRIGGDEFMVLLHRGTNEDEAKDACERMAQRLRSKRIGKDDACKLHVSIGIGSASGDDLSFAALYKRADEALYRVKRSRKDGFEAFVKAE